MIVVTGATGFVGRYLVERLVREGETVIACGRSEKGATFFKNINIPFEYLDVSKDEDFENLPRKGVKALIHLAAVIPASVTNLRTSEFINTNTIGTFKALEYCRKCNVRRFINTTTRFEVDAIDNLPIRESMGRKFNYTGAHAAYVISKVAAAEYVEHYQQEYGVYGLTLRLTGLFGYGRYSGFTLNGQYHPYAIEVFIERAKKGDNIEVWGKPQPRDNLYVKDAVGAIIAALQGSKADGTYNVASGKGVTLQEYAQAIAKVFSPQDKMSQVVLKPKIETVSESYIFDISKMERDFCWQPQFDLEESLIDYKKEIELGRYRL